jgi:hypothetical protein
MWRKVCLAGAFAAMGVVTVAHVAMSTDGTSHAILLLEKFTKLGNVAPAGATRSCRVYAAGVDLYETGTFLGHVPLRFSPKVPSLIELLALLAQADQGTLRPGRMQAPDSGYRRYTGYVHTQGRYREVVLMTTHVPPLQNDASAAQALVEFLDLNCR